MKAVIFLIIISIIILRFALFALPSFKIDTTDWQAWTSRLLEIGPVSFYSADYFADYFPGYLYVLLFLGRAFIFATSSSSLFSNEFIYLIKTFTNFFDLATAYLIYKIVKKYQPKWSILASILYLCNPALIFNSSIWGQVDAILTFFLVLSSYYLIELKQSINFSISLAISFLIKPQTVALMPITFIHLFKTSKPFVFLQVLLVMIALPIVLSIPFFINSNPIFGLFELFKKTAEGYQYTSLYAFNLWAIIGWWQPDSVNWLFTSFRNYGIFIYSLSLIGIIFPLIKKNPSQNYLIYLAISLSLMAFFLFPTRVHERYLFPFFAFFLIAACIKKSSVMIFTYFLASLIHLLNLWYVYFYYNWVYSGQSVSQPIFILIDKLYPYLSLINILLFISIIIYYYYLMFKKTKNV